MLSEFFKVSKKFESGYPALIKGVKAVKIGDL